jgi:hypothetical protein
MASIHKNLLTRVVCIDTAKISDCLMSNVWLMSDDLMGEENVMAVVFGLVTSPKFTSSIPDSVIGIPH